ncbi:hypothetical protein C8R46DRAFT_1230396 [Mycena filopes]|nr:hypothetical protein C8R46DRAFT_1230396 [Mycena filopes]
MSPVSFSLQLLGRLVLHSHRLSALFGLSSGLPQPDTLSEECHGCVPVLPTESWEYIFTEADSDDFLVMAAVCRTFNVLCSHEYLRHHGATVMVEPGRVRVDTPANALRGLRLHLPEITYLSCKFAEAEPILQELRTLRGVVSHAPKLQELHIEFPFHVSGSSNAAYQRFEAIHNAFHDVTYAVVKNTPTVISVDPEQTMFRCCPAHLSALHLDPGYHTPSSPVSVLRRRTGRPVEILYLAPNTDISGLDLSQILPHLCLPNLRILHLHTPKVHQLTYNTLSKVPKLRIASPGGSGFHTVKAVGSRRSADLEVLLEVLRPHEPAVIHMMFTSYSSLTGPIVEPGRDLLARIARRSPAVPTTLTLTLDSEHPRKIHKDDLTMAAKLRCVKRVELYGDWPRAIQDAINLLPWVRALPALEMLQVVVGDVDVAELEIAARATLPPTVAIEATVWGSAQYDYNEE